MTLPPDGPIAGPVPAVAAPAPDAALHTLHTLMGDQALVAVADAQGRLLAASPAVCRIWGVAEASALQRLDLWPWVNDPTLPEGQAPPFSDLMWALMRGGEPWLGELWLRSEQGVNGRWSARLAPARIVDGVPQELQLVLHDRSLAHRLRDECDAARDECASASGFAQSLSDSLPVEQAYFDRELRYRWANQAHCQALGLDRSQVLGRRRDSLIGGDVHRRMLAQLAALPGHPSCSFEAVRPGPRGEPRFNVRMTAHRDDSGELIGAFAVETEITHSDARERELSRSLAQLRGVLEASTQVAILASDLDGRIVLFNRGAEQMLGYAAAEVVGKLSVLALHDPDELSARAAQRSAELGRTVRPGLVLVDESVLNRVLAYTFIRKDGGRVPVAMAVTPQRNEAGEVIGFVGIAHDTSERMRHEQSLREAMQEARRASQAKSQFLSNMSHEIRTPMNAVIGLTHLIGHTPLDREQADLLGKLKIASQSLMDLIDNVLDISRIEAGEIVLDRQRLTLRGCMDELLAVLDGQARDKGVALHVHLDDGLPEAVWGDGNRLRQGLTNLVANAIKFTHQGEVSVQVSLHPSEPRPQPGHVRVCWVVRDTGIGIAPDQLDEMFLPFVQADGSAAREFGGTGLGLYIARRLAVLMGGTLQATSELRVGSAFTLTLDLEVAPEMAEGNPTADRSAASLAGLRLLVVDDSDINREVAARCLQLRGAQVVAVADGGQAVRHLTLHPDGFDAVLMDVQMPLLDGHATTRQIRSMPGLRQLPVIALTAGVSTVEHQRALDAGMNDMVGKPFDPEMLARCVLRHTPLPAERAAPPHGPMGAQEDWPEMPGIDTHRVRQRLCGDVELFRKSLQRLVSDAAELDAAALPQRPEPEQLRQLAAHWHKIKGGAGTLGDSALSAAAARAEAACRDGDADVQVHVARALAEARRMARHASAVLARATPVRQPSPGPGPTAVQPPAPDPADLQALLHALAHAELSALADFQRLRPWLRTELSAQAFAAVCQHLGDLQFESAHALLNELTVAH